MTLTFFTSLISLSVRPLAVPSVDFLSLWLVAISCSVTYLTTLMWFLSLYTLKLFLGGNTKFTLFLAPCSLLFLYLLMFCDLDPNLTALMWVLSLYGHTCSSCCSVTLTLTSLPWWDFSLSVRPLAGLWPWPLLIPPVWFLSLYGPKLFLLTFCDLDPYLTALMWFLSLYSL